MNSEARLAALEARLLAALSALLASQQHSRPLHQPDPALLTAAGTARSVSVNLAVVHFSGSDDSFSEDEFSEYEESLATADPQSHVPVSPSSSSPSYTALVYRIWQEYGSDGTVPTTISHIAYALVMEGVLLVTIVGGVYSVRFCFASKSNQSKARSLLFTELVKAPAAPPPAPLP